MRLAVAALALLAAGCAGAKAPGAAAADGEVEFRALYKELIEINTTASSGSCTRASEAMKARLVAAGYPESDLHIIIPPEDKDDGNLIALLPGSDAAAKHIVLLAHIDVVEANRADWERDPFVLTEENGYFFARGAVDDKAMAAIFTDAMIRWKTSGYRPERTIKLALTCGEEGGSTNGVRHLIANHRELIDGAFALNEGGGGRMDSTGRYLFNGVQAGEKLYQDYTLVITNPGGHSSRPVPDNAIYRMADALEKVSKIDFPVEFNDATRGYFERMADIVGGQEGADMKAALQEGGAAAIERLKTNPTYNSLLHTTCVATQMEAGHAPNALPQRAATNVNCRIFPGRTADEIADRLQAEIGDGQVKVTFEKEDDGLPVPPPALTPEIMGPIEKLSAEMFPGVPIIPAMASGATDGRPMNAAGIPTYGVSGIFTDPANTFTHGLNERIPVRSLMEGREFLYRLTMMYAGGK
jgi:acetylornithine deacetylase/succinyl-diaminopimelate desuccinylase-like protein